MTDQFLTPTEVENIAALEAEISTTPEDTSAEPVEALALPEAPSDLPLPTQSVVPEAVVAQPEALSPKPDALPPAVLDQWQHAQSAIQQLEAQRDTLAEQYEAGVIGFKEYRAQERTLERHQREAESVILQAQMQAQMHQERVQSDWNQAVVEFRKEEGSSAFESPVVLPMMQAAIESLRAQHPQLSAKDQLQQAKAMVQTQMRALLGMEMPAPPAQNAPAKARVNLPPTLGAIPVAATNDGDVEFSHLGKLSGFALEKAVAKMSGDQRERWLMAH